MSQLNSRDSSDCVSTCLELYYVLLVLYCLYCTYCIAWPVLMVSECVLSSQPVQCGTTEPVFARFITVKCCIIPCINSYTIRFFHTSIFHTSVRTVRPYCLVPCGSVQPSKSDLFVTQPSLEDFRSGTEIAPVRPLLIPSIF